jgi:hypothetical protein
LPIVIMPEGASAAGEAFELVSSRYLCRFAGLSHLATPFYTHLERGRWVQFDGLFSRGGDEKLVLEAKCYGEPVSLATAGLAARVTFAKESGASGIIISSKAGFCADLMRINLPVEKILISWKGMRKGLAKTGASMLTAALDGVTAREGGFTAASGAVLHTDCTPQPSGRGDGIVFLPAAVERWLRRLPAAEGDIDAHNPPRRRCAGDVLDIQAAWTIEDSLRGFAPSRPQLLELGIRVLSDGPVTMTDAWKALWRLGYRGRIGGAKNALENLCAMRAASKFRNEKGLFYELTREGRVSKNAEGLLATRVRQWPAFVYFKRVCGKDQGDKNALAAKLSAGFAPFFPYAKSLYNPAKVSGLTALDRYLA